MKEELGYICPQTKKQCDDECCVSAEDCHAEAINSIISNCEPEQLNQNKMGVETSEILANYKVGDVCQFKKLEEGHPIVFTTHKVDIDYGVVYYYMLDGTEESVGTSYIKKINL